MASLLALLFWLRNKASRWSSCLLICIIYLCTVIQYVDRKISRFCHSPIFCFSKSTSLSWNVPDQPSKPLPFKRRPFNEQRRYESLGSCEVSDFQLQDKESAENKLFLPQYASIFSTHFPFFHFTETAILVNAFPWLILESPLVKFSFAPLEGDAL